MTRSAVRNHRNTEVADPAPQRQVIGDEQANFPGGVEHHGVDIFDPPLVYWACIPTIVASIATASG